MDTASNESPEIDLPVGNDRSRKRRRTSAQPAREVGLMRSIQGDKFSGFVGSASGIYFIRSVYGAVGRSQPTASDQVDTPASDIVPGEDDHLPSVIPTTSGCLWQGSEIDPRPKTSISFEELVEWTGSFFANWHPFYPFLHAPSVLEHFEELSRNELSLQDVSTDFQIIILRSIMSISLADRRQAQSLEGRRYPIDFIFQSYDTAVDSLRHVLSRPTSIHGLQAAISVQLFLVSMLRLNAASRLGGLINRMALQLGLHRCPARYSSFSASEKKFRKRVFWSLYTIDRFICQSMGLPLGIHDDDVDVCFPTDELHLDGRQQRLPDRELRLFDFLARQCRLRGEIIELRNKSLHYVHKDPDQATAITAKLTQWWNAVEELSDANDHSLSAYHVTILTLLKHESNISLYRPILAAAHRGANYDAALQLCIGSARSIIMTLYNVIKTNDERISDSGPLTLLWPSCTWAVWISTFILFYAANSKHLSQDVVARLANRSVEILQHLAKRGSAWPEASAAAIRDLRARMADNRSGIAARYMDASAAGSAPNQGAAPSHRDVDRPSTTLDSVVVDDANHRSHIGLDLESNPGYGLSSVYRSQSRNLYDAARLDRNTDREPSQDLSISRQLNTSDAALVDTNAARNMDYSYNNTPLEIDFGHLPWNDFLPAHGSVLQGDTLGTDDGPDPFSGFDIPFWFEQDQHWDILQDFS